MLNPKKRSRRAIAYLGAGLQNINPEAAEEFTGFPWVVQSRWRSSAMLVSCLHL
ncbi:MAG: hypothetical protein ICV55_04550 [Coleofasciculus sp. C3-bin4]|nr:hypothetical protein [Coleofasciculus sp. C3-bin4]